MTWIKKLYLYVVSLVSLIIIIVAAIGLVNMGLKQWVFTKADTNIIYPAPCPASTTPDGKTMPCSEADQAQQQAYQDKQQAAQKQRDFAQYIAMIVVASPVFWYHWKLARKEA